MRSRRNVKSRNKPSPGPAPTRQHRLDRTEVSPEIADFLSTIRGMPPLNPKRSRPGFVTVQVTDQFYSTMKRQQFQGESDNDTIRRMFSLGTAPPEVPPPRNAFPTLADSFLSQDSWQLVEPTSILFLRQKLREAKRFVLDTAATIRFAEFVRDCKPLIIREQAFARAPYDQTWIEFNYDRYREFFDTPLDNDTTRMGFLIDNSTAYSLIDTNKHAALVNPVKFELRSPWTPTSQASFLHTVKAPDSLVDNPLTVSNSLGLLPTRTPFQYSAKTMAGASLFPVLSTTAILLLLTRPSLITYLQDVPSSKHFHSGKHLRHVSYTVITIESDPRKAFLRKGASGEGSPHRRHGVRGHYATSRRPEAADCLHVWLEETPTRWRCAECGAKRWWRKEHERGSEALGRVVQSHHLRASQTRSTSNA